MRGGRGRGAHLLSLSEGKVNGLPEIELKVDDAYKVLPLLLESDVLLGEDPARDPRREHRLEKVVELEHVPDDRLGLALPQSRRERLHHRTVLVHEAL